MYKCYIELRRTRISYKNKRKVTLLGHILRRNCFLKHVIEGKIEGRTEVTGRGGRRPKQLLDYLNAVVPKCTSRIPRDLPPVSSGSIDTFIE